VTHIFDPSPKQTYHWSNVWFSKMRQIQLCYMALENDSAEQVTLLGPCLYLVVTVFCENYGSVQIKQG